MFHFGDSPEGAQLRCSFCGKTKADVRSLIAGPGVYICDECVELCQAIIAEESARSSDAGSAAEPPTTDAAHITSALSERLPGKSIGRAIRQLSFVIARHVRRSTADDESENPVGHVMIVGPTGSGKTALAHALRDALPIPVAIVDMTQVTETGYFGVNPSECLLTLVKAAEYDLLRASRGILVLDHFDLVDQKGDPRFCVQREFLCQLEGTTVDTRPTGGRRTAERLDLDTKRILYVACGTFEGRETDGAPAGSIEALRRWGLVTPLLARLPHRIVTVPPDAEDLEAILVADGGAWHEFLARVSVGRPTVTLADDAPRAVAEAAASLGMGAWGLAHVIAAIENAVAMESGAPLLDRGFIERIRECI